jgi:hypothetical protein
MTEYPRIGRAVVGSVAAHYLSPPEIEITELVAASGLRTTVECSALAEPP